MRSVVLYGRPGCHLCEEARSEIEQLRAELAFDFRERDIETDDELLRRYLERIPVVTVDGVEAFEYFVDRRALRGLLEGASIQ